MSRVLTMKRQGYRIAEIARVCGKTTGEVLAEVKAARKTAYQPTLQEIAAKAMEIRKANGHTEGQ